MATTAAAVTPQMEEFELSKLLFGLAKTKDNKMHDILATALPKVLQMLDPKKPKVQAAAVKVISHVSSK